jgi:hypothetical protein
MMTDIKNKISFLMLIVIINWHYKEYRFYYKLFF